jgi:penicillin-binding protein 2
MEKSSSRLKVLALMVACMFAALTIRLWFLQVLATAANRQTVHEQSIRTDQTTAQRGVVLWSDGTTPLVNNRLSLEVRVSRQELEASPNPEKVLLRLSNLLKIPVASIRTSMNDKRYLPLQPKPIAEFVPKVVDFAISEHPEQFPGVQVVRTSVRNYPDHRTAAHIVGYLGQIDKQELAEARFKGYGLSDLVGKSGVESTYEKYLRGTNGEQRFIVNSNQDVINTLQPTPSVPGDNLVLTLDQHIQQSAQKELVHGIMDARGQIDTAGAGNFYLKATAGAAVVMDVKTGGIVAMASYPTFDPSWTVKGLTRSQNNYLNKSSQAPTLSRATQLTYKPGSTFKPIVALTAAKEGIASFGSTFDCPATYTAPGDTSDTVFTNWSATGLGGMSMATALSTSCDTVFYPFGYKFWYDWKDNPLGVDNQPFQRDLRQWGYGRPTGVDLPSEASGVIPDYQFAEDNPAQYPYGWTPGGDILLSIGSGDTLATPLQVATAYSAIANGGHLCRPHVVDRIVAGGPGGNTVKHVSGHCVQLPYTQDQLSYIRGALGGTTRIGGTAASAFLGFPLIDYPVAGKTGTAERSGTNPDNTPLQSTSWFASFAPVANPRYVVVVMVEQGGYGSQTAAPIARHIYEDIYGIKTATGVVGGSAD